MESKTKAAKAPGRLKNALLDALLLCVGAASGAFSAICVMVPNGLTCGGVTGTVRILTAIFPGISFSLLFYGFSALIFLACLLLLGVKEAGKILIMSVLFPFFMMVFERWGIALLGEKDIILGAVYCGILYGICNGLVLYRGYSTGGTDTICKIVHRRLLPHVPISSLLLASDVAIILTAGFVFGVNIALYAVITSIIMARVVDMVIYGFKAKFVEVEILSDKHEEIALHIVRDVGRGVTMNDVTGAFSGTTRKKLSTVCSPKESLGIKSFISQADAQALMTVNRVEAVWGRAKGFLNIEKE